jgi:hypothetical protein
MAISSQHAALEFLQKHGTVLAALVHEAMVVLAAVDGFFSARRATAPAGC